jgi:LysM repeat protein
MARRFFSLSLLFSTSIALSACSWFQKDDGFSAVPPAPAAGEVPQVTPAGQTPVAPGAAATPGTLAAGGNAVGALGYAAPPAPGAAVPRAASAPIANEQFVRHTIVSGDSLWKLARTYKTSAGRISEVNGLTSDKILAGQTITIPTTSPPPGAQVIPAPAAPAAAAAYPGAAAPSPAAATTQPRVPSALNPVVRPLPTVTTPSVGPREPIAIPRPVN